MNEKKKLTDFLNYLTEEKREYTILSGEHNIKFTSKKGWQTIEQVVDDYLKHKNKIVEK